MRGNELKLDWTMAETTAFGGNAVMRFRIGHERPSRHVLKGSDPLMLQVDGIPYEILHIWLFPSPTGRIYEPRIFVRAPGGVDAASAERVVKRLTELLPWGQKIGMWVFFRADAWFPAETEFPYYCPLCDDERLPTKEESTSVPRTSCMLSQGKISCYPINVE